MPSPADAQALQQILADLATLTIRDVVALWRRYSDNPDFRVIVEAAFPEIVGQYAAAGALATAQQYDELAPDLEYRAQPVVDLPAERFTKTIGWALYAPGRATPLDRISGAAQRMIFDASRDTVRANLAAEYGDRSPELGTRWARYASATACGFCRLLATRKAVYRSAESATRVVGRSTELTVSDRRIRAAGLATTDQLLARRDVYERNTRYGRKGQTKVKALRGSASRGSRYHDNCRCIAVPVRPGQSYEPPDYVARWDDDYQAARAAGARTPGQIAAAMDKAEGGRRAPKGQGGVQRDQIPPPATAPGGGGGGGGEPPIPPRQNSPIERNEDPADRLSRLLAGQARDATQEQRASVVRWQSKDERFYQRIQQAAVGELVASDAFRVVDDLQELMEPLPEAVEVWRGIRDAEKTFGVPVDRIEELVGTERESLAFFATSLDRNVAETEFTRPGRQPAIYKITAQPGTPALWVPPLGAPEDAYQRELLFPPGVVLRILGIDRSFGVPIIEVEVSYGEVGR